MQTFDRIVHEVNDLNKYKLENERGIERKENSILILCFNFMHNYSFM